MEDIAKVLENFCSKLKGEILEFYDKCYLYFKDLYSYKEININTIPQYKSDTSAKTSLNELLTATNSALNTIGIAVEDLSSELDLINELIERKKEDYRDFDDFFRREIEPYINNHLFKILIENLINIDTKKIENLDLFDLLPHKFLKKLIKFKQNNRKLLENKNLYIKLIRNIEVFVNTSKLTVNNEKIISFTEGGEILSDIDILKQLKEAREKNIEVLKKVPVEEQNKAEKELIQTKIRLPTSELAKEKNFLDFFGNFPVINPKLSESLNINTNNLLNAGRNHPEYIDLENLFYYLIIIKYLGIDFPFNNEEILRMLENHVSGRVFSSGKFHKPNPMSNFYGLSILAELKLISEANIIDLLDIEMYLEGEIKSFYPENIFLNFYTIMCLKLLEKSGEIITDKSHLINSILNLNLVSLEQYNAPLDIFYYLCLLKLLGSNTESGSFKYLYLNELKNLITPNGSINDNVTDSVRALLIIELLGFKNQEVEIVNGLFSYINNNVDFFSDARLQDDFNWNNDQLGFKIELRMLFWVCLAYSQYFK